MGHPSYTPKSNAMPALQDDEPSLIRQRPVLRLSRMPRANALITSPLPLEMALLEETFRRMGTEPPGRAVNDDDPIEELTEDELFAVWSSRLL
jgi:hypothetical protein